MKVNPERTTQVHAGLRIPSWIGRSAVRINGRKVAAAAGTFHSIAREWAPRGRDRGQHPHAPAPGGARGRGPIHKGEYIDERVPYCAIYKGASAVRDGVAGYAGRAATPSLCGTGFSAADLREVPAPEGVEGSALRDERGPAAPTSSCPTTRWATARMRPATQRGCAGRPDVRSRH